MHNHAPTKSVHVASTYVEVPQEVTECQALEEARQATVSPDAQVPVLIRCPGIPLGVEKDKIQAKGVDDNALQHADDVYIPVGFGVAIEMRIDAREEASRQTGRCDASNEGIEAQCEKDFMCVQRQRW